MLAFGVNFLNNNVKNLPTLLLGIGTSERLKYEIKSLNNQNTLIIADSSLKESKILRLINATISSSIHKVNVHFIENVKRKLTSNYNFPTTLLTENYDAIIGIGSNDLLNYTKIVALFSCQFDKGANFSTGVMMESDNCKRVMLLPSTVTYGIEVTNKTYIYNNRVKIVKNNELVAASTIIYDPLLVMESPLYERVTAGIIAFAHAFEIYFFEKRFNKFPVATLNLLFKHIIRATYNKRDIEAQEALLKAGMLLGLTDVYCIKIPLINCFVIPIMRKADCSYAVAISLILPYIMNMYREVNRNREKFLAKVLDLPFISEEKIYKHLSFRLANIFKALGYELTFESIGISAGDISALGTEAFTLWLQNNLRCPDWNELHFISAYRKAYERYVDNPFG